jgi:hypothetical protein
MPRILRFLPAIAVFFLLMACTEAVEPVYRFEDGFLLVEGRITDTDGLSEVRIARNEILFDNYVLLPVNGAMVSSISDDGEEVVWIASDEEEGVYKAPQGFVAQAGKSYFLRATTPEGELIESAPERVPTSVPMENVRIDFKQEAYYSEGRGRFVPAFDLLLDVVDPADEENYYQYNFSYFEEIFVCASCIRSRWRNGECIAGPDTRFVTRWDYLCDARCWISTRAVGRNVMSDAFGNGLRIEGIQAGRLDWERQGGVQFILNQFNTSRASFEYNSVIESLTEGTGGLNAPLPSALVGNLKDLSANQTGVLGFVGVSAVNTEQLYMERDTVDGTPLPFDGVVRLEPVVPEPPRAPCVGGTRSYDRPAGWPL